MKEFLNNPFPHSPGFRSRFLTALGFGIFVSAFLLLFRPFEMDTLPVTVIVKSSLSFGLVTFGCILGTNYLLEFLFPHIFQEEKWTTGKQILNEALILLMVAVINYLLFPVFFNISFTWANFLRAAGITLSVGLLPIIIYTLYKQNSWLQQFRKEAAELQRHLDEKKKEEVEKKSPHSNEKEITITGDGQREKLSIRESELVYIEAASNYVKVYFEQKEKLAYTIIRTTMKKVEELFADSPVLFRCHRAYMVHLEKIEEVEGNAQGYKLKLVGTEERIPVSRNLNREFADRLLAVKNEMNLFAM